MKKNTSRGFTLIELLVVIAIIGILSSVVLASLSTARNKGKGTAIKAALNSLRTQMEVKADGGAYGPTTGSGVAGVGDDKCDVTTAYYVTDPQAKAILDNIKTNVSDTMVYCSVDSATVAAIKFAVAVTLPDGTGIQCVDNSGNVKLTAGAAGTAPTTAVIADGACK